MWRGKASTHSQDVACRGIEAAVAALDDNAGTLRRVKSLSNAPPANKAAGDDNVVDAEVKEVKKD